MKVVAIVPAAGRGRRMNHSLSKQYLPLGGKPILARTLLALESSPLIDEILVSVREDELQYCKREVIEKFNLKKVKELIPGGEERQDSVYNALKAISKGFDIVIIHDSVRPFVTKEMVKKAIKETKNHQAAVVAIPMKDTIKEMKNGFVRRTLDRNSLWAIQTPQVFSYDLILEAYEKAYKKKTKATDDASLVENLGHPVKVVEGSPDNLKITTPEDLILAEAILKEIGE